MLNTDGLERTSGYSIAICMKFRVFDILPPPPILPFFLLPSLASFFLNRKASCCQLFHSHVILPPLPRALFPLFRSV